MLEWPSQVCCSDGTSPFCMLLNTILFITALAFWLGTYAPEYSKFSCIFIVLHQKSRDLAKDDVWNRPNSGDCHWSAN